MSFIITSVQEQREITESERAEDIGMFLELRLDRLGGTFAEVDSFFSAAGNLWHRGPADNPIAMYVRGQLSFLGGNTPKVWARGDKAHVQIGDHEIRIDLSQHVSDFLMSFEAGDLPHLVAT